MNHRLRAAQQMLSAIDPRSVLDVGCRDCEIRTALSAGVEYYGNDLSQNQASSVHYVGDVLSMDFGRSFDCVVALDVLEHLDDPYSLMDKLASLSERYLLVSLPNIYDVRHKYHFVFQNTLGGKYRFGTKNSADRHRWLMNYDEICEFYAYHASKYGMAMSMAHVRVGGEPPSLKWKIARPLLRPLVGDAGLIETVLCLFRKPSTKLAPPDSHAISGGGDH